MTPYRINVNSVHAFLVRLLFMAAIDYEVQWELPDLW